MSFLEYEMGRRIFFPLDNRAQCSLSRAVEQMLKKIAYLLRAAEVLYMFV